MDVSVKCNGIDEILGPTATAFELGQSFIDVSIGYTT